MRLSIALGVAAAALTVAAASPQSSHRVIIRNGGGDINIDVQMLGVPVTLLSLLILDTPAESLSEDFSVLPVLLNPPAPGHIAFHVENQGLIDLPIFSTAIFHPPHR